MTSRKITVGQLFSGDPLGYKAARKAAGKRFAVRYNGKPTGYETAPDKAAALAKCIARNPHHLPALFALTEL